MSLSLFEAMGPHSIFNRPFTHNWGELARRMDMDSDTQLTSLLGAVDVTEDDTKVDIHMDLPGMTDADVKIDCSDGDLLTVSGERKSERGEKGSGHYERSYGSFSRSFRLGDRAVVEQIQAKMDNGVLHLHVPKKAAEEPKSRSIPIAFSGGK
jgi:HSP20 family protein